MNDYISLALKREDIKCYADLKEALDLGYSLTKVWSDCKQVFTENEKNRIKEILKEKNVNIEDFSNGGELLRMLFSFRRNNKDQTVEKRKFCISDNYMREIIEKYPETTIKLIEDRCNDITEFKNFMWTYEKFRREFSSYKLKEKKGRIEFIFRKTKTYSIAEFVIFVNDTNIISGEEALLKILGKNSLRTLKFNLKKCFPKHNMSAKSEENTSIKVAETLKIEEKTEIVKETEKPKAVEESKTAEVVEKQKTVEKTEIAKETEKPKAVEESKTAEVVEKQKTVEKTEFAKETEKFKPIDENKSVVSNVAKNGKDNLRVHKYKILDDGLYEWSSGIGLTKDDTIVAVDTNILMSEKYRKNVINRFRKIGISSMVMRELRNLTDRKEEAKFGITMVANNILNKKSNKFFPIPDMMALEKLSPELDRDIEIIQSIVKFNDGITFVTADAGAAVYAWSIGCPCRFIKRDLKNTIMQKDTSCVGDETVFIDMVFSKNLVQRFGKYSKVVISSEYAKMLNKNKSYEDIKNLQIAIATDSRRVFIPEKLKSDSKCDRMSYESEVIKICLEKDYTLISYNKNFLVYACSFGVKVSFI